MQLYRALPRVRFPFWQYCKYLQYSDPIGDGRPSWEPYVGPIAILAPMCLRYRQLFSRSLSSLVAPSLVRSSNTPTTCLTFILIWSSLHTRFTRSIESCPPQDWFGYEMVRYRVGGASSNPGQEVRWDGRLPSNLHRC